MTVSVPVSTTAPTNALERRYREWRATTAGWYTYGLFVRFAQERLRIGRRFGVKALAERVRWETETRREMQPYELKVNNNFVAYIARDLIREVPALTDLIEVRRVKED